MASKKNAKDTVTTVESRGVHVRVDQLAKANPDLVGEPGEGKPFTKASLRAWLLEYNNEVPYKGKEKVSCDEGSERTVKGLRIPKGTLIIPEGFKFVDTFKEKLVCAPPTPAALAQVFGAAPAPEVQEATLTVLRPTEFARQSTESEGPDWRPGSMMHALETFARSGVVPAVTYEHYALKGIVPRHSVKTAGLSGQLGGEVNGNDTGDHLKSGKHSRGENPESKEDNGSKKRHAVTGDKGYLGGEWSGPRGRQRTNGHIVEILPDGTMVRNEELKKWEFPHGGRYAITLPFLKIVIPSPIPPIGAVVSSPRDQLVVPATTYRWGIDQALFAMNKLNEGGWDGVLRSEQTRLTGPMETPDRIYATMFAQNAANIFSASMDAAEKATDPAARTAAARTALIAWRDLSDNAMIRRADSMHIPMDESRKGIEARLTTLGVDVASLRAEVTAAPRLVVADMAQEVLEKQQDFKRLRDSRYEGITPGQTNPAYAAAERYAYRTMNAFEVPLAKGQAQILSQADMALAAREVWQAATPESARVLVAQMQTNSGLAKKLTQTLHDVDRNWQNYGFASHVEARAFTDQFVGDDKAARKEIYKDGDTTPLPLIGKDERYAATNPHLLVAAAGPRITAKPELLLELMDRASNPAFGVDKKGRTDGRAYSFGMLREMGAEMISAPAKEGDMPPAYAAFAKTLGADKQTYLFNTTLAAVAFGESGAGGLNINTKQSLDNLYKAAQLAQREGTAVITDQMSDAERAALTQGKTGEVVPLDTGAVDARGVFAASRKGDMDAVYTGILRSQEARDAGRDKAVVLGLCKHLPQARDAVLLTMLRNPRALDKAIVELESRDDSMTGDRYGKLTGMLKDVRKSVEKGDDTKAVQQFADFFADIKNRDGKVSGALRMTAWNGLLNAIGNDDAMSAWVIDTAAHDAKLRNGILAAIPSASIALDGAGPVHSAGIRGQKIAGNLEGDEVYVSRYFTLPEDGKGKGKVQGGKHAVIGTADLQAALAAAEKASAAAVGAGVVAADGAGGTRRSTTATTSGATGVIGGEPATLDAWLSQTAAFQAANPNAVLSASDLKQILDAAAAEKANFNLADLPGNTGFRVQVVGASTSVDLRMSDDASAALQSFVGSPERGEVAGTLYSKLGDLPAPSVLAAIPATIPLAAVNGATAAGATISGALNASDADGLKAVLQAPVAQRATVFDTWVANHQAGKAESGAGLTISGPLSEAQRNAVLAAVQGAGDLDARLANVGAVLSAFPQTSAVNAAGANVAPADQGTTIGTAAPNQVAGSAVAASGTYAAGGVNPNAGSLANLGTAIRPEASGASSTAALPNAVGTVAAVTGALTAGGVLNNSGVALPGNPLNTNPVIVIGTDPKQDKVAGLASYLEANKAVLNPGTSYLDAARALFAQGLVTVSNNPGSLAVVPNSAAIASTLATNVNGAAGVLSTSLLLLLIGGKNPAEQALFRGKPGECIINGVPVRTTACL